MKDLKWYLFDQNNSGGRFDVDDKVCHRLFIQAKSEEDAVDKAEELGCYWNGVAQGIDCPCCGDRWSQYSDEIDIEKYSSEGYGVCEYCGGYYKDSVQERWNREYGNYEIGTPPTIIEEYGMKKYAGTIKFHNIEEYAQYLANKYGWTIPDARIYYADGTVNEIFSIKLTY